MKSKVQRYSAFVALVMTAFQIMIPAHAIAGSSQDELIYPLKQISKLDCRFEDFDKLSSNCKQNLPVLNTKDYKKYATQNGGYNDFTRIYTVLWGASYKYGWDVGNGGHLGTDIATAKGTPIYSIADGKVIKSGSDVGWGKYVSIEHTVRGKKVISNYAHMSKILVSTGEKVDVGDKIWEVGSTGNSTGNHLHFQIDLPNTFHPYYYDWNACPYSFYKITEDGVCFDELAKSTFDPLAFLESNGAILDEIEITQTTSSSNSNSGNTSANAYDRAIFSTTVYHGYGSSDDVREVQKIYKELGYYKGSISGDFSDVEESIIDYQVARGVIASRTADGAGWFGPKTRTQTEKDYKTYLAGNSSVVKTDDNTETTVVKKSAGTVEKVSRAQLLTREEIEAMEIQQFLKSYDIKYTNKVSQIEVNDMQVTTMEILKANGRNYKGNTPGNVHFEYDRSKISVFPEKFYSFANGDRDIKITGKAQGHTTLKVMIGDVIIETFSISVGKGGAAPEVQSASMYVDSYSVLGEVKTAVVNMKDQYGNRLVKAKYDGTYEVSSNDDVLYCIKRGTIQDIKALYKEKCLDEEFTKDLSFNYGDTISGVLMFDYKVIDSNGVNFAVKQVDSGKTLVNKKVVTKTPKGLDTDYQYFKEVIESLAAGVTSGIHNEYFAQDKEVTRADATTWIKNILREENNVEMLEKMRHEDKSRTKLTREEFLELANKYLWDDKNSSLAKSYRDLDEDSEVLVASLLWEDYKWKDNFGENYFQPNKKITRGEAAYLLMQALGNKDNSYHLVRK